MSSPLRSLLLGHFPVSHGSSKRAGTDDFSEQDDVLAPDEEHAAVGLGVRP